MDSKRESGSFLTSQWTQKDRLIFNSESLQIKTWSKLYFYVRTDVFALLPYFAFKAVSSPSWKLIPISCSILSPVHLFLLHIHTLQHSHLCVVQSQHVTYIGRMKLYPGLPLISPALAFLYSPLTSLCSQTCKGASTNTSKKGRLAPS